MTQLVLACLATFVASVGGMWGLIAVHAQHPHEGTVTSNEIVLLQDLIRNEHAAIRREIALLSETIHDRQVAQDR